MIPRNIISPCKHWALVVASIKDMELWYLDPKCDTDDRKHVEEFLGHVAGYLELRLGLKGWKQVLPGRDSIPQQPDGFSCGVYTIVFADMVALGIHHRDFSARCGAGGKEFRDSILTLLGGPISMDNRAAV